MTKRLVTLNEVLELLDRVVKREGSNTMRTCRYVAGPYGHIRPWCIAGCVLAELGISVEVLTQMPNVSVASLFGNYPGSAWDVLEFTPGALDVLAVAQGRQDCGLSWVTALEVAQDRATTYWMGEE